MKNSYLTVTDQFCGAGGSSQGVRQYSETIGGGVEVKMALNHWKLAIETHNTNFPDTDHDCTDVSACDPRRYPSTDILITSPECTVHSPAGGKIRKVSQLSAFKPYVTKPEEERSRATMWDVPRFAEYHNYNIVIVENVVEAREWINWSAWIKSMHNLGYDHECCYFNSMHFHPTPQSRDRMYVIFWKKGNKKPDLNLRPIAYSPKLGKNVESYQSWKRSDKKWGKYRQQYVYRCSETNNIVEPHYYAAFNVIDWTIPGRPVHEAVRSKNTLRRIQYGLDKYGQKPLMVNVGYSSGLNCRVRDLTEDNLSTVVGTIKHAFAFPFFINTDRPSGKDNIRTRHSSGPLRTQTTAHTTGIAIPFIVENNGLSKAKSIFDPIPCMTTQVKHGIINPESVKGFMSYYYGGSNVASGFHEALRTMTTKDRCALVQFTKPTIENCKYRTIKPHEVQSAMAFDKDYVVLGNGKQKVKQLGNAVTPPVMNFLIGRTIETLL